MRTFCSALALSAAVTSVVFACDLEKGWKGLQVLSATRVEVEKVLGAPVEDKDGVVKYETDDAFFRFLFSDEPCSGPETLLGGYNVKAGTVLQYQVQPKNRLRVDDLKWDKGLYESAEDRHQARIVHYYNRRDAIRLEAYRPDTGDGEIVRVIYFERTPDQNSKFGCKPSSKP